MKMVTGVMWFTPVGVSSVIAGKILGVDNVGELIYIPAIGIQHSGIKIVFFYTQKSAAASQGFTTLPTSSRILYLLIIIDMIIIV